MTASLQEVLEEALDSPDESLIDARYVKLLKTWNRGRSISPAIMLEHLNPVQPQDLPIPDDDTKARSKLVLVFVAFYTVLVPAMQSPEWTACASRTLAWKCPDERFCDSVCVRCSKKGAYTDPDNSDDTNASSSTDPEVQD